MQPITLAAQVIWWDAATIFAHYLCPFCEESHARSFPFDDSAYKTPQPAPEEMAVAGNPPLRFRFEFPFSEENNTAWYVIDKQKARFVALGMDGIVASLRSRISYQPDDLTKRLERLDIDSSDQRPSDAAEKHEFDATCDKTRTPELERKRKFELVLEEMGRGNCRYLKHFLETSGNSKALLHTEMSDGNTALGLAAQQPYPNIVQILLKYGADVNAQCEKDLSTPEIRVISKNDTPLIFAVRNLHFDNAWHLVNHCADKALRNVFHYTAMDYANGLDPRIGMFPEILDNSEHSKMARKIKSHLLVDDKGPIPMPSPRESPEDYVFEKQSQGNWEWQIRLSKTVSDFFPDNTSKTIAVLKRPGGSPDVAATSGWGRWYDFRTDIFQLPSNWTESAMYLGGLIGFEFPKNIERDHGQPGRYHACHAEAKLITFMAAHHAFVPATIKERIELQQLAEISPPVRLTQANILVSNEPCPICEGFKEAVNAYLGLKISLSNRRLKQQ
ncbi:uncharacterized protein J3D65DRAFT_676081 [Phyllosticta citribraziliensis]|uniref:Single-strand DNA deaminase toxin A-like C-terminal domain-containing protein n=1 Tax=Phyllosticta citribraziliensis TaxID=989973 RepID=A0ABR1LZD9_9PEZI